VFLPYSLIPVLSLHPAAWHARDFRAAGVVDTFSLSPLASVSNFRSPAPLPLFSTSRPSLANGGGLSLARTAGNLVRAAVLAPKFFGLTKSVSSARQVILHPSRLARLTRGISRLTPAAIISTWASSAVPMATFLPPPLSLFYTAGTTPLLSTPNGDRWSPLGPDPGATWSSAAGRALLIITRQLKKSLHPAHPLLLVVPLTRPPTLFAGLRLGTLERS